jgi:small subunit ribosomal protein S4
MSRYTGPRVRVMRALGTNLPGLSRKDIERRPNPPGEHGGDRSRKLSEYGLRLREKQKLRLNYGLTERQFRRVMEEAIRSQTRTDAKLIELLERRLDNVVFRAGFARTIPAARQLVNHGHVRVNGRAVNIASFLVSPGQVISLRVRSQKLPAIEEALTTAEPLRPAWLEFNPETRTAVMRALPDQASMLFVVQPQLIIEFYSLRL